jgi:A1 cistron-splicing factor AAR2
MSSINMSAEEAAEYAAILCLDVPAGITFGIDYMNWTTGERFQGVKLVPPGVHFVFTSQGDSRDAMAPRLGFFVNLARGEVCVRQWDSKADALLPLPDQDQAQRLAHAVRRFEFDARLGAYPRDSYSRWVALSQYITPTVLTRLEPVQKFVFSAARSESVISQAHRETDPSSAPSLSDFLFKVLGSGNMFFSDFSLTPDASLTAGCTSAEITAMNLDKTPILLRLLQSIATAEGEKFDDTSLIGELQLTFVAFMLGQSLTAFEAWKKLISLLTSCAAAISSHPELFTSFIRAFAAQLFNTPADFFDDDLSAQSFIQRALKVKF